MTAIPLLSCGLLVEHTPANRLALARLRRAIGWNLRRRSLLAAGGKVVVLSFAMSARDVRWAVDLARASGSREGLDFVGYAGDGLLGPCPPWLVITQEAPADPWLGLRPSTWARMEPDVRALYEQLRHRTPAVFRHVDDLPRHSAA